MSNEHETRCAGAQAGHPLHQAEALQRILDTCMRIPEAEHIPLEAGLGRVLYEDVLAPLNVPPDDNSAMDGYAMRAADLPSSGSASLRLSGRVLAGHPLGSAVGPGECVSIMTGALIPDGADTVVMREQTQAEDGLVRIGPGHRRGENIRRRGEDLRLGEAALARGRRLRPADLGLIASLGIPMIKVFRRPRVALFSTGDEICNLGDSPRGGQIYDSNRYSLRGLLEDLGAEVLDLGILPDEPERLRSALRESALSADAVLSSGGVSVGEADHVTRVLSELGRVSFWKIAIKPGRPLAFGILGQRTLFFGLPGNPVAAMVTFIRFVRPALQRISGQDPEELPSFEVPCLDALKKVPGRTEFQRGTLRRDDAGRLWVGVTGRQGSGILHSMSQATCLIVLEHDRGPVAAGETVTVQLLQG
ncbi:MAG: molybdopterin molybdenumtransferase MoeA [Thioalkalivibrio sp.]|nr:MAG: molybdopterin molybdenumtransferase MoeA [Thioalkalivibrio sp.]